MWHELSSALNDQPTYLFFTVTSRCNAFCDFCWNWENVADAGKLHKPGQPIKRAELSLEEIKKIVSHLPKMLVVNLYGGEPFIREDIDQIIGLFSKECSTKYISIPTNGFYSEKIIKTIDEATEKYPETFFKLYLSLDGPEKDHNRIRKLKDGYNRLIETMQGLDRIRAKRKNLSIACNLNYNSETQHYMKSFVQEVMSWNVFDTIGVDLVRGILYRQELDQVDHAEYAAIQSLIKTYRPTSAQPFSPLHKAIEQKTAATVQKALKNPNERVFNCFAGKKILILSDNGDVMPCEERLKATMGNIRDFNYDLNLLLQSEQAVKIRKGIVNKECNCRWDCGINTANIFDIKNYPDLLVKTGINLLVSPFAKDKT
jgi:sulfatase maturation enzyme AslB (radical SAM superfamily)